MTQDLVRVAAPSVLPPDTVFGEFYHSVVSRLPEGRATTNQGAVVWTSHVVDAMLYDGFWPLVLAVGKRIGLAIDSPAAVQTALERIDRVLAVGLEVRYGSPEAAADAFLDLVHHIDRAFDLGLAPGKTLSSEAWKALRAGDETRAGHELASQAGVPSGPRAALWQVPVYQFFAECLKTAREHADAVERLQDELVSRVSVRNERGRFVRLTAKSRLANPDFGRLEVAREDITWGHRQSLVAAIPMLERERARLMMLATLPIDRKGIGDAVNWDEVGDPARAWMCSQILLAVQGIAGRQYLETLDLLPGLHGVKALASEEVVSIVALRLQSLGFTDDTVILERAREYIDECAAWLRVQPVVLNIGVERDYLIRFDVEEMIITPSEAVEAAMGEDPRFHPGTTGLSASEVDRLRGLVVAQLRWDTFDLSTVKKIIKAKILEVDEIMDGITRMSVGPDQHDAVVAWMRSGELTREDIGMLFKLNLVDESLSNVAKYVDVVPQRAIDELVMAIAQKRSRRGFDQCFEDVTLGRMLTVFGHASASVMAKVLADARSRPFVAFLVSATLYAADLKIAIIDRERFRAAFDGATWQALVLGAFAEHRRDLRRAARKELPAPGDWIQLPWNRLLEDDHEHGNAIAFLGDEAVAALAIERCSEEDALRWLYAARGSLDRFIAEWREDRDGYEAAFCT